MKHEGMTPVEFDLYVARKLRSKADNAKSRGIEFNLSFQSMKNLLSAKRCYYTGIPLTKAVGTNTNAPSDWTIDRIDCTRGYVPGNVVAACFSANQLKAQLEKAGIPGLKAGENIFKKSIKRIKKMGK